METFRNGELGVKKNPVSFVSVEIMTAETCFPQMTEAESLNQKLFMVKVC